MTRRTPVEVYRALRSAGDPPAAAVVQTAIAGAESGWDDTAVGDVSLQDAQWGPSVGLFQVRTVKRETGHDTDRDVRWLQGDVGHQAAAAVNISHHGTDMTPWTTYTRGTYQQFMPAAQAAAGGSVGILPVSTDGSGGGAGGSTAAAVVAGARPLVLQVIAVGLGLALVGVGLVRAVAPTAAPLAAKARKAVGTAAKVAIAL